VASKAAATVVSGGRQRVDLDRVCEIHDRLVDFPLRAVSEAAMIERIRISRGDLDSLSEICDSAIVRALGLEDATAVEVGIGVPRIDFNRLGIICDSVITVALEPVVTRWRWISRRRRSSQQRFSLVGS
jgi:hypothetical protein